MGDITPVLLTPREAAQILNVSRSTLYRALANDPEAPAPIRFGPRVIRFRRSHMEAWTPGVTS